MKPLTKAQEQFIWHAMKAGRPVSDYGSAAIVRRNLEAAGYVEEAGKCPVGHFMLYRPTLEGLRALVEWHRARWAKRGCVAYLQHLQTAEGWLAQAEAAAAPRKLHADLELPAGFTGCEIWRGHTIATRNGRYYVFTPAGTQLQGFHLNRADCRAMIDSELDSGSEFVLWGVDTPKGATEESILRTANSACTGKIKGRAEAASLARWLEQQGCTKVRIQEIDLSQPFDFARAALGRSAR